MSKEELLAMIDKAVEPAKMSKSGAVDFLEELRDDIAIRIEALKEELGEEEE